MTRKSLISGIIVSLIFASGCGRDGPTTVPSLEPGDPAFARGNSYRLTVNKSGTGTGTITSSPSGINCGATCSKTFSSGTIITLTATPSSGSVFAGWSGGGCSGTGTCRVDLRSNTTVTASFNTSGGGGGGGFTLTVSKVQNGNGSGYVTSAPAGISCDPTCSASYAAGTSVTLNIEVATGRFASWSGGGCSGNAPSCTVTLTASTTVTATFETMPVVITTSSLPNGNRGAEYNNFLTSSGGMGSPDKYSLVSGSLPRGLTMDESFGVQSTLIHGTPTTEGTSTFTVRVTDQSGSSTKTFSITIDPPTPVVVTLPGATSQPATVGTSYFQNLFADGGSSPYTWSITAGQLPPGLALIKASNGNRVQGTPTTAGTFTFTLTATDTFGSKGTQQTSITVSN